MVVARDQQDPMQGSFPCGPQEGPPVTAVLDHPEERSTGRCGPPARPGARWRRRDPRKVREATGSGRPGKAATPWSSTRAS
jgi:hypothetical protein